MSESAIPSRPVPKRIHKLDDDVKNKIAAGETIVRPANAVKEMMENSLDAGATDINITVKNGGLESINIQDNGCGMKKEDLPIACERYTTSKIETADDLAALTSFGFRGEALASISFIAKVKIITKTADSPCAYEMEYSLGLPSGTGLAKPTAGKVGTNIIVENFFYNNPIRRSILSSASEEFIRVHDVVTKYAMRYPNVGFTLKKYNEHVAEIRTTANSTTLQNCKILFGNSITRELLAVEGKSDKYHCDVTGYITNPNFSVKKYTFLLFINGRAVDCSKLRRSLELIYAHHLPKNSFPFIFLSIELPPRLVDANIHPAKAEVCFRFEEEIIAFINGLVQTRIANCQESRTFMVQTQLPRSVSQGSSTMDIDYQTSQIPGTPFPTPKPSSGKKSEPRKMIRTDIREQTLDAFIRPVSSTGRDLQEDSGIDGEKDRSEVASNDGDDAASQASLTSVLLTKENRRKITLSTLLELRAEVEENMDVELRRLIAEHRFVGCASHNTALIQYGTKLYAVDVAKLSEELFYQLMLYEFGNFGLIKAAEPVALRELIDMSIEFADEPITDPEERLDLLDRAVNVLMAKADMLADYFSLQLNKESELVSLPMLLSNYTPPFAELPLYLARLVTDVDWTDEKTCFKDIARVTAQFYAVRRDFYAEGTDPSQETAWKWTVEHVIFPALRAMLQPDSSLNQDRAFFQLADLPNLYKVFERC